MNLFLSSSDGSPMIVDATTVATRLSEHLDTLSRSTASTASIYESEWHGTALEQRVEVRLFKNHKAIEFEGAVSAVAETVLATAAVVGVADSLVLFDEANEARLTLTERTSASAIIATWSK